MSCLLNYGDSYEEDLKIGIWKTTSKYIQFCFSIFLWFRSKATSCENHLPMCHISVDICFIIFVYGKTDTRTKRDIEAPTQSLIRLKVLESLKWYFTKLNQQFDKVAWIWATTITGCFVIDMISDNCTNVESR